MDYSRTLSRELNLALKETEQAVKLLEDGNTIPFIARYRKEATGEMDENTLRLLAQRLEYLKNLARRKEEVLRLLSEQGILSPEIKEAVDKAESLQQVEDLYRPYRPKRRTKAGIAKEQGLQPLADMLWSQKLTESELLDEAKKYLAAKAGVESSEAALSGACDIIAEQVADDPRIRETVRKVYYKRGKLVVQGKNAEPTPYEMYYEYTESLRTVLPHRILAINRGEREGVLRVKISVPEEEIIEAVFRQVRVTPDLTRTVYIKKAVADGCRRLLFPSLEREIRNNLTKKAEAQALQVFSHNLHHLLLAPPVRGHRVMGIDPGYRTGCKLAVVDETGKLLETGVIYPHPPQKERDTAAAAVERMVKKWGVTVVAIGNGTASRETEALISGMIQERGLDVKFTMVSEAGASVYSASPLAGKEFPGLDLTYRSAVSLARRLQDPLAELVKIEPKAVGVGQYQHDINPQELDRSLAAVVESCVNTVGVELNTASPALLQYVAGFSSSVAEAVVAYREKRGVFRERQEILKVPRLGARTFQQCAGFIRIRDGVNPLDNTPVHPESYKIALAVLQEADCTLEDLRDNAEKVRNKLSKVDAVCLAVKLQTGVPTVRDIIEALKRPGRDPREDLPPIMFRRDILTLEDLREGLVLWGTVRNVVDFGVFVDIGVKQDGLIHLSQLSDKFIRHPLEVVAVGDQVKVAVLGIDKIRGRISLTMKGV